VFSEPDVESRMAIWFWWTIFKCAREIGEEVGAAEEEGLRALRYEKGGSARGGMREDAGEGHGGF
jgi:hypothetical protein